jgi:glutamate-1-semialdehyde aminotransferase
MRFPGYSVSRYSGIDPDLICLGKAIASGMPLSIVGGKKEIMDNYTL